MNSSSIYPLGLGDANLLADPTQTDLDGSQYYPEAGLEPFDLVLTALQAKTDLSQYFGRDHDFLVTGLAGTQTGSYKLQLILPDFRQLSTAQVNNSNLIGTAQFPVPIWPAIRVPAGGKIGINITDLSNAGNTIQIVFLGVRLYRTQ